LFNTDVFSDSYFYISSSKGHDDGDVGALPMGNAPDLSALSALQGASPATAPQPDAPPSLGMAQGNPSASYDPTMQTTAADGQTPIGVIQNPAATASQPAVAPPMGGQPSVWKQVAASALLGLSGGGGRSFGQGLGTGAAAVVQNNQRQIENQRAAQQQQSDIKFRDLQSAHLSAQLAMQAKELQNSTQEHNDQHDKATREAVEWNQNNFGTQYDTIPNNPQNVLQYMRTATANGAAKGGASVPAGVLMDSSNIYVPKDGENTFEQGYKKLSLLGPAIGAQVPSQDDYNSLSPSDKKSALNKVNAIVHGLNPATGLPYTSSKEQGAANASLESALSQYDKGKDSNPNYSAPTSSMLHSFLSASEEKENNLLQHETAKATADSQATEQGKLNATNSPANQSAQVNLAASKAAAETSAKLNAQQNSANTSAGSGGPVWVPKVSADEKKKAELGENIAYNANEVTSILQRRPDLLGAVAGRYTSTEQMVGNNDPDISALGVEIHNIAMANSSVHGFRSNEGVKETEGLLLNNFKNGATAITNALKANVGSVQTFIDAARPSTYQTHSAQGGALKFYGKAGQANFDQNDGTQFGGSKN
jgi:hypothetical protein